MCQIGNVTGAGKNDRGSVGFGAIGQVCLLCPDKDVAFIAFSQCSKAETLLSLLYTGLLDSSFERTFSQNSEYVPFVALPAPMGTFICPNASYQLEENPLTIASIGFIRQEEESCLHLCFSVGMKHTLSFAYRHETRSEMYCMKDLQEHLQTYVCRVVNTEPQRMELCMYYIDTRCPPLYLCFRR